MEKLLLTVNSEYKEDFRNICLQEDISDEERNILEEGTNLEKSETFVEAIESDLMDKGFTKEEIDEIVINQINQKTAIKYIAYVVSLVGDYDSYEEFMENVRCMNPNIQDISTSLFEKINSEYEKLL